MQFYERVLQRVNGALAAHFGKTLSEPYKAQVLGFVYSQKYEYQLRFDDMEVVGREAGGKVEAVLTPTGLIKRFRVHPHIAALPADRRNVLLTGAVCKAKQKGRALMEQAELQVYGQFLRDIKPWVYGLRDNPEFFTIPEDAVETKEGILAPDWMTKEHIHRTIPFAGWESRQAVHEQLQRKEQRWLTTPEGFRWSQTLQGQRYLQSQPAALPRGAPGRIASEDKSNRNVAYDLSRKRTAEEQRKNAALWDMWVSNPATANRSGQGITQMLLENAADDIRLRAARVDWTIVRADDRARAKREAQDQGLEPHYQNAPQIDVRRHWFIKRRDLRPDKLWDYDVTRQGHSRAVKPPIHQYSRKRFEPYCFDDVMALPDSARWNLTAQRNEDELATLAGKGWLGECMLPRESWQSRLAYYPEAKAKF
eukprot:TRINITY_DN70477_c0_g1_i1.p1 TRINITY_DN70477_c0_g1~~TRINITY_DN70477_c0_g1_i1.p1  ORF type:complete len:423 (+),score=162.66 TRINITY_DN70477_c0_g1_i1:138-1406(+)